MPSRRDYLRSMAAGGFVGLAGCAGDPSVSGRWPRAGYDRRNTGDATGREGPGGSLTTAWTASFPETDRRKTPVVVDGRVCVGYAERFSGADGDLGFRVFDAVDGERIRDVAVTTAPDGNYHDRLLPDSLVVRGDAAYLVAYDGVHSYSLDGEERWHRPVNGRQQNTIHNAGHPVVIDGTVFAPTASITEDTSASEGLLAIDDGSGETLWRYEVPPGADFGWTYSTAYADGTVYLSMMGTGVVALAADTGEVSWLTELPAEGPPTVAGGRVYIPTEIDDSDGDEAAIRALDAATGNPVWRKAGDGERLGREIAAADGRLYCREDIDAIVCRDAATGSEQWRYTEANWGPLGRPVVMDGVLYAGVGYPDGDLPDGIVALDPSTGERIGGLDIHKGPQVRIAASEERLFVTTNDELHAVEACTVDALGRCLY